MGRLTSTLILVVVLAGLGGYIYFIDAKKPLAGADGSTGEKEKVFTVDAAKINELRITYKGESTLLKKDNSGWKIVEPAPMDADPPEAIGVAPALTNVEIVRVIDENPTDLEQFGLAKPAIAVDYKAEGGASGTLKLGNKNATQGEIYALKNNDKRVFLVSSFQETSFNRTSFDLRDKKILKFDGHFHGLSEPFLFKRADPYSESDEVVPSSGGVTDTAASDVVIVPWNDLDERGRSIARWQAWWGERKGDLAKFRKVP